MVCLEAPTQSETSDNSEGFHKSQQAATIDAVLLQTTVEYLHVKNQITSGWKMQYHT